MAAVTFTPVLVSLADSDAPTGSTNYMAALVVPSSTPLGLVILHYSTMDDMRQKNLQMVRARATRSMSGAQAAPVLARRRRRADSTAAAHSSACLFFFALLLL
jgi:hypothetical protein